MVPAAEKGDVKAMERLLLLSVSPDIHGGWHNGTSLHIAAEENNLGVVQLLLKHNADIEARDEYKRTPLHYAALCNSTEVTQVLLQHNADVGARDEDNQTLFTKLHYATA